MLMKKFLQISFTLIFLFGSIVSMAQNRVVSGNVKALEDNFDLPGVSVLLKGTTTGTITDVDGNYKITVPDNAVLVFSFVGFKSQEITVGARAIIDVQLESDIKQLSEVVVTAAGIEANKRELGYSIQNVDADEVRQANETNFVSALSGKIAGVQVTSSGGSPGAAAQIRIRGNKTVQGSNAPLFVIDGIPIDNSTFNTSDSPDDSPSDRGSGGVTESNRAIDINPEDVASLTVLKGPAATVLYGIRAANGAVVITTKRGSKNSAPKVSYAMGYSVDKVNKLPDLQRSFAQGRFPDDEELTAGFPNVRTYFAPESGTSTSWGPAFNDLSYSSTPSIWDVNGSIVLKSDPTATGITPQAYDNADLFFQNASTASHNISVQGGSDKTAYYFSVGRLDQSGILPNSSFGRTSVKLTTSTDILKNLSATISATYIKSGGKKVQNGSNTSGVMLGLLRTAPSFDNSAGYEFPDGTQRAYRGGSVYDNPFFTVNKNFATDEVNRFIGYTQFSYDPMPWLNITYRVGTDSYGDDRIFRNAINSSTLPDGQVINQTIRSTDLNSDLLATVSKGINEKLNFSMTVGHNYYYKDVHVNRIDGRGLLPSPDFYNIAAASSVNVSEGVTRKKLYGLYGTMTLKYDRQLFLNLSGRNDWSSTLPEDNNSFFYSAASLGWDFTQTFGINSTAFNYGKLRASWGQVGNDPGFAVTSNGFNQSKVFDGWTNPNGVLFPAFGGTNSFNSNGILGSQDLKAEITTTMEFGGDFQFMDGKVGLDLTYFVAKTTDAILNVTLPSTSGFQQRAINSAEITNKGIEAALTASIIEKRDFSYNMGINFTRIRNEVVKLAPGIDVLTIDPFGTQRVVAGYAFGTFFGTRFLRDDQGNMVINPSDGMPYEDTTEGVVGDPNPDYLIGFRNTVTYKNFTLSFLLDIRKGGDVYNGTKGVLNYFGVGAETLDRDERIIFPGVLGATDTNGNVTATTTPNNVEVVKGGTDGGANYYRNYGFVNLTELTIEDGGWVRMRDISLSYNLPKSFLGKSPFSAARITLNARNLFLITDYTGIDPETNLTGDSSNVLGYDYFNNPNTKSYGINVNLTF
jgi:TonB-linked SusC/RagA family outer membrane protein